jgi:hypothetical protein
MIDVYPQSGDKFDTQLESDLHEIGFTGWVNMHKEQTDSKVRLTWN